MIFQKLSVVLKHSFLFVLLKRGQKQHPNKQMNMVILGRILAEGEFGKSKFFFYDSYDVHMLDMYEKYFVSATCQ